MKKLLLSLVVILTFGYTQAQNMVSVEKLVPITCPANYALASKQMDTIARKMNVVYTKYDYTFKAAINIQDWLYRVQSANQWYSTSGLGARLDGKGIFLQDVIGENPPSGTGTSGALIQAEMNKTFDFNIKSSYITNANGSITVTTRITTVKANTTGAMRYIAYIQDDDTYPNEFRQFITPWNGIALPIAAAGKSKTYTTTMTPAQFYGSTKFKVVVEVSDSVGIVETNGTIYQHEIKVASYATKK